MTYAFWIWVLDTFNYFGWRLIDLIYFKLSFCLGGEITLVYLFEGGWYTYPDSYCFLFKFVYGFLIGEYIDCFYCLTGDWLIDVFETLIDFSGYFSTYLMIGFNGIDFIYWFFVGKVILVCDFDVFNWFAANFGYCLIIYLLIGFWIDWIGLAILILDFWIEVDSNF